MNVQVAITEATDDRERLAALFELYVYDFSAMPWLDVEEDGRWEVRQKPENVAATEFWRRAIGRYANGRFDEVLWDDARWRDPVQRFDSSSSGVTSPS